MDGCEGDTPHTGVRCVKTAEHTGVWCVLSRRTPLVRDDKPVSHNV